MQAIYRLDLIHFEENILRHPHMHTSLSYVPLFEL